MSIIENLNLIKQEKEAQKELLSEEYGEEMETTPFTQYSVKFGQSISDKKEFKDLISSTIVNLDGKYSCGFFEEISTTILSGSYLKRDGKTTEFSAAYITEYIPVNPYETLQICSHCDYNAYSHVFFDKDKNVVSYYPELDPSDNKGKRFIDLEVVVPQNAKYIRAGIVYSGKPAVKRIKNGLVHDKIEEVSSNIMNEVELSSKEIDFNRRLAIEIGTNVGNFVDSEEYTDVTDEFELSNGWYQTNGIYYPNADSKIISESYKMDIISADCLYFTGNAQYETVCLLYLDGNGKMIFHSEKAVPYSNYKINSAKILKEYPSARYVVFSSYQAKLKLTRHVPTTNEHALDDVKCSRGDYIDWDGYQIISDHYLANNSKGEVISSSTWQTTEPIDFIENPKLRVTTYSHWSTAGLVFYNSGNSRLSTSLYDSPNEFFGKNVELDLKQISAIPALSSVKYIRVGGNNTYPPKVEKFKSFTIDEMYDNVCQKISSQSSVCTNQDYLYGKKYVSLGDSFTATGVGTTTPYPNLIAARHGMVLKNYAVSGMRISNPSSDLTSTSKYFPLKYPSISGDIADADYVTMCFGLNETGVLSDYGTSSDTDTTTIFGSYNVMLESILSSNPDVKLGIIVADAWTPDSQAELIKSIGAYWGIPVLDMKNDPSVSMMMGGRTGVNSKAKYIRSQAFTIPSGESGEGHPNQTGHDFRSTIIENFIKSL